MDYTKISKEISYALRHAPWEYELELDPEGYVAIKQLLAALNEDSKYDMKITVDDLMRIIDNSDKKRHEIQGDKIRAEQPAHLPAEREQRQTHPDFQRHNHHRTRDEMLGRGDEFIVWSLQFAVCSL